MELEPSVRTETNKAMCAFAASLQSISAARRFVADYLGAHPTRDVAVLITSELATNAVQHASSSFVLEVDLRPDAVRVAVQDESAGVVHDTRELSLMHEETGRGLHLVEALSRAWGVQVKPEGGKIVWAEI